MWFEGEDYLINLDRVIKVTIDLNNVWIYPASGEMAMLLPFSSAKEAGAVYQAIRNLLNLSAELSAVKNGEG